MKLNNVLYLCLIKNKIKKRDIGNNVVSQSELKIVIFWIVGNNFRNGCGKSIL